MVWQSPCRTTGDCVLSRAKRGKSWHRQQCVMACVKVKYLLSHCQALAEPSVDTTIQDFNFIQGFATQYLQLLYPQSLCIILQKTIAPPNIITIAHEILQRREWQLCKSMLPSNNSNSWARQEQVGLIIHSKTTHPDRSAAALSFLRQRKPKRNGSTSGALFSALVHLVPRNTLLLLREKFMGNISVRPEKLAITTSLHKFFS
jgi:hypothetical protein